MPSEPRRHWFLLRAPLIGVDIGPLPKPTLTFGLAAGVRFDAFEATLGARLGSSQTIWVDGMPTYGAEVKRATGELRGCYAPGTGRFRVAPCLLAAVDRLTVHGVGDQVNAETNHTAVFAVGAGATGRVGFGDSWALVAMVGGQLEVSRARVVVEGLGEVVQLSPFAFTASAGVEWSP